MEAITRYGSRPQALVHCWSQSSASFNRVDNLSFSKNPLPKKLVVAKARASISSDHEEANRPLCQFPPSLLSNGFLSVPVNHSEMDGLGRDMEALKPRVSNKLVSSETKERILLIHTLVSLGVSYHFEKDIQEFLKDAFEKVEDMTIGEEDLFTISVIFRVFRLYGHNVSSDMFNRFKEEDGNFKESLVDDVRGMLSLYEASHYGTTREEILEEATSFTQKHLELFVGEAHVSELIQNVLHLSPQENIEVLMARQYIRFYQQETHRDKMLLKLAKLNFKLTQLHFNHELETLVKWWKELDLESKIPNYFRERVVECHFWAIGIYMEPQYSAARIILSKALVLYTILDDACDAYCTLTEVICFVESLNRWEVDAVDTLPDHFKILLRTLIDLFEEFNEEVRSEGRFYSVQYSVDELKRLCNQDLAIAKWARTGCVPTYDEYMEAGLVTGGITICLAVALIGMGDIAGKEAYEWLLSKPKLLQSLDRKSRLRDDLATFKDEMSRGEIATGINCYMKQYEVTEEEAFLEFERMVKHSNQLVNEELLKMTSFLPLQLLRIVLNFGRIIDVNYKYGDGLTYTELVKVPITSLLLDLITL